MHISINIELSRSCSFPTCQWIAVRVGVCAPDPEPLLSSCAEISSSEPLRMQWVFMRLYSKAGNDHLVPHNYILHIPDASTNTHKLNQILVIDILGVGIILDTCTASAPIIPIKAPNEIHDPINCDVSQQETKTFDTILIGRYTATILELLSSHRQTQEVSIASIMERSTKLADLTIMYIFLKETEMDEYILLTLDDSGIRGYLSLCAKASDSANSTYNVVYQEDLICPRTGIALELALPQELLLCYSSTYGLAVADRDEVGIPGTNIISCDELKRNDRDLVRLFSNKSPLLRFQSNTSLSTLSKNKYPVLEMQLIKRKCNTLPVLYMFYDKSLSMRFEWFKTTNQESITSYVKNMIKHALHEATTGNNSSSSEELNKEHLMLDTSLAIIEVNYDSIKWNLKEALEALRTHITAFHCMPSKSYVLERTVTKNYYDRSVGKGIYLLVLSSSTANAELLHQYIKDCHAVVLLIFVSNLSEFESINHFSQYYNVATFSLLQPNYCRLRNVLLAISGCIRYNEYSEEAGQRPVCICGYHKN